MKNRQLKYFYLSILLVCTVFGTSLSQKIVTFAEEETEVVVSDEVGSPGDLDSTQGELGSTQGDLDSTLGEPSSTQGTGDSGTATGGTGDGVSALLGGPEVTGGTDGEAEEETAIMQIEEEPVALMAAPMMSARLAAAPTTSATTESADLALAASPAAAIPSGLNETQETYSVPSGSVTIQGIGETYTNDSTSNAIQKAVEKAIQYATVNTSHTSTIVVKNGTYEGGLTIDTTEKSSLGQLLAGYISEAVAGGGSVTKEDIVLRIIAEDIIGENGSLLENTYSSGDAQMIGDINISGLNVVLAGIYLSTKGSLSIKDAGSFEYIGTAQDDRVSMNIDNVSDGNADTTDIKIDSGGGDDDIEAKIVQAPTYSIGISKGSFETLTDGITSLPVNPAQWTQEQLDQVVTILTDLLKDEITIDTNNLSTQKNEILIELGTGNDQLDAKLINSTNFTADFLNMETLAVDETLLGFKLDLSKTALTILGQDGNDEIALSGGMALDIQYQFAQQILDDLKINLYPNFSDVANNSTAVMDGGHGDDLMILDTTAPFSSYRECSYQITDTQGSDRLHLTGKLDGDVTDRIRLEETAAGDQITLKSLAQISFPIINYSLDKKKDLNIVAKGIEMYTDELANKNQVSLSTASGTALSYTDYILDTIGADGSIDFNLGLGIPNEGLHFSNVIATAQTLTVNRLLAAGMNVFLNAVSITVNGIISCVNLMINAVPKAILELSQGLVENDLEPEDNLGIDFTVTGTDSEAKILITAAGDVKTSGGVFLKAENIQDKFYIDSSLISGDSFNHFSYKDANAIIIINGKIDSSQAIRAQSILCILLDGDEQLLSKLIPFSIQIATGSSTVTVGEQAVMDSQAGVFLEADSYIHITSTAHAGPAPIAIALAVATPVTYVVIQDDAAIRADGDVILKADSITRTINVATGKPANVLALKAQSGGFIALTVIDQETYVRVLNNAKIESLGKISLQSGSVVRSDTAAVSIPADDSTGTIKTKSAIKYAESLLGVKKANNQSLIGKVVATITGSNFLGNLFTSGTSGAEKESSTTTTPKSTTQLMGSLGAAYVVNENQVLIDTTNKVSADDELVLNSYARTDSFVKADGSLYKTPSVVPGVTPEEEPDRALGIGVTVVYYHHGNNAEIRNGLIFADGILVNAQSGYSSSVAISKSGHIPTKNAQLGVGGAITVHIVSDQTQAILGKNAIYHIKSGDVVVTASAIRDYVTVADASGKRTNVSLNVAGITIPITTTEYNKSGTGIGAGIAVAIIGGDVLAQMEDGVILIHDGAVPMNSIRVDANSKIMENTYAAAGAGSATAIVPVIATDISGFSTQAVLGSGTTIDFLQTDAIVMADSSIVRTLASDAAAVGTGVGVGGSFTVSVYNDSTKAYMNRSVNARNIMVSAKSIDRMNGKAKASATGAAPPAASTPTTTTTASTTVGESDGDAEPIANLQKKGEADKIADQNLAAASNLSDKSNTKNVNKSSVDQMSSNRQQAQTSEGNVQVAAAFAVNIMKHMVLAEIGSGLVLIARAINGDASSGAISVIAKEDTDAILAANASATKSEIGVGVAVAVNVVTTENKAIIGKSKIQAKTLLIQTDSIESRQKKTVEEILESLITYLVSVDGMDLIIGVIEENLAGDETLEDLVAQELNTQNAALPEGERRTEQELLADKEAANKAIKAVLVAKMKNEETAEISSDLVKAVVDSLMEELFDILLTPSTMIDLLLTGNSSAIDEIMSKAALTAEVTAARIEEAVVAYMRSRFGGNDEADGLGSKISTSAISGAGASNIGIAGAVAVTVLTAISQALILDLDTALAEDITVTDGVVITSDRFQKLYTTATGSADKQGAPDKNKNATGTQSSSKSVGVGAAAAVSVVDATSEAGIGKNRTVKAGSLDIRANLTNDLETVAVAGQDPIAHREAAVTATPALGQPSNPNFGSYATSTKSISVDAAAAVGVITNTVRAYVDENTKIFTLGSDANDENNDIETIAEAGKAPELVNLYLYSGQTGETYTSASAFACGTTTAVGAAVAVNLATSDVESAFLGHGELAGNAKLDARTFDADESHALASVTGANLDRYLEKFRNVLKYMSPGTYPSTGSINAGIVNKLNILANPVVSGVTGLTNNMPLSSSAMSSQKTATTAASDTTKAQTTANQNTSTPVSGQSVDSSASQGQSINIAAAVAVNVTKHTAQILQKGILQARRIALNAQNQGNFLTKGSGATVTPLSNNASNLSLGVAVTTNSNQALVTINGELIALGDQATVKNDGDIAINATLTQNMDGQYKGLLAAQAIAGSVAGSGGKVNASGAVAVMTGNAKTIILITDGSSLRGGAITINAIDKSKYAVRAGSANISTGTKAAIGASFALIYAQNITKIQIGDTTGLIGVLIEADSLNMKALKEKVDQSDYQIPFDESTLFTVDAETEKGLINLTTTEGSGNKYSVSVTLGVDDLLKAIDLLNYLSSVNYYAEAIAGTIVAGTTQVAVAGSMAMVFLTNETTSEIGKNVTIILSDNMTQTAEDTQNSRIISGALSASKANVGVGLTVGYLSNDTKVSALIGDDTNIQALSILSSAKATTDIWVITAVASVVLGSGGAAIGGAITAVDSGNQVLSQTGNNVILKAVDSIQLVSQNNQALTLISASVSGSGSVAVGGTVAVIVIEDETTAQTGAYNNLQAGNFIKVSAQDKEDLLNVLASLSGATGAAAVAGTLGVIIAQSQTIAQAGNYNIWNATNGDILILADSKIDQMFILATAAGSTGQAAVGATVTVYVFNQKVKALTGIDSHFTAGRNIMIQATGANNVLLVTVAGAAAGKVGVSGAIPVVVMTTQTLAETGSANTLIAQDSVGVIADQNNQLISVAGSFSGGGNVGVGATIHTAIINNNVKAGTGDDSHITGYAMNTAMDAGIKLPGENRTQRRHGVIVNANNSSTIFMLSASGAASGNVSVTGVVNTMLVNNQVEASIGKNTAVNAREVRSVANKITSSESDLDSDSEADVEVEASDDTDIILLAGGVSVSGSVGVGATIAVTIIDNTVTALIKEGSHIYAADDILVLADSDTKLTVLLLAFGVAGSVGVAGAVSVILFENKTLATVQNDSILIAGDEIQIKASQDNQLISVAAGIAGGEYAGVVAVAPIVKFLGTTSAMTGDFNILTAGGNILIAADSKENIITAGMGLGGGIAGVGGTFELLIMQVVTKAYTGTGNIINGNQITIQATDHYALTGAAGTVAGGAAGVGLSLLVSLSYNTVTAYIGENSQVTALSNILVRAESDRQISAYAVTAGVGGAAVSGTVVVVLAGSKLNQESYEDINNSSIKPQSNVDEAFSKSDARTLKYSKEDEQGNASDSDVSAYLDQRNVSQTSVQSGSANGNNLSIISEDTSKSGTEDKDGTTKVEDIYGEKEDADGNSTSDLIANADTNRPLQNLKDTTAAYIGAGSIVKAAGNISIIAVDNTTLDVITGAVAFGGGTGVGIGASIVILYSNVLAFTQAGSVLEAGGSILVQAAAGSVAVNNPDSKTVTSGKAGAADSYTLRVITVVGALGLGGTSLSLAIASVDIYTTVEAFIGNGSIIRKAANVTVSADSNYGLLQVITAGVSVGNTAIVATISRANYDAVVRAAIESGVVIEKISGTLAINLNSNTTLQSDTISAGGGIVAANAAVALAFYTMRADAYIGQGVVINQCGDINLLVEADVRADAKILGITVGGVALGANVVLIKLTPVILNYIGSTPVGYAASTGSNGTNGSIHAKDITLSSHVTSKTTAFGIAGGVGIASLNGSVVIAINRTASIVAITGMDIIAEDILIDAGMDTSSVVTNTAINVGAVNAGLVVGYAETKAVNKAYLDASNASIQAKDLSIYVGKLTDMNESLAQVTLITGTLSIASASMNAAVALNEFTNHAMLIGNNSDITLTQTLLIEENMTALSQTTVTGVSAGIANIGALVALSFNRADGRAYLWMTGNSILVADKMILHSYLNLNTEIQAAQAQIYSGAGSLISINGGVALAAARAQNQAYAKGNLRIANELVLVASGSTNAKANIAAVDVGIVAVGIMITNAYAQGGNHAWIQNDAQQIEAGSVLVESKQTANAYAETMAGTLGYVVVKVNIATAVADAVTDAYITGMDGNLISHANLVVNAVGETSAQAVTKGIKNVVTVGIYKVTGNVAVALMTSVTKAYIQNQKIKAAGILTVSASQNQDGTKEALATCEASLLSVGFVQFDISQAVAINRATVQAFVEKSDLEVLGTTSILAQGSAKASGSAAQNAVSYLAAAGVVNIYTYAEGSYIAYLDITDSTLKLKDLIVKATLHSAKADSQAQMLSGGLIVAQINIAYSKIEPTIKAYITGNNGQIIMTGNGEILAVSMDNNATAVVKGVAVISGVTIAGASARTVLASDTQAYIDGTSMIKTGSSLTVRSDYKATSYVEAQSSSGVSLITAKGIVTFAEATAVTKAFIEGAVIEATGNVFVLASGHVDSDMRNNAATGVSILGVGVIDTDSYVKNTVLAYVDSDTFITAGGSIWVTAEGSTDVILHSVASGGGLYEGKSIILTAKAEEITKAQIMDHAKLSAQGDILVHAEGSVSTDIFILSTGVGAIRLGAYVIKGIETLDTQILIDENADLYAKGNLVLEAMDKLDAANDVTLYGAGLLSGTASITQNTGNQTVWITVGKNAKLKSGQDISITTAINHQMNAKVTSSNIGLASIAAAVALNDLIRNNKIMIQDGSSILAGGNIIIAANSMPTNRNAAISTIATGGSAGLFEISGAKAESRLNSNTDIIIGNGNSIITTYGDVDISAVSGSSSYTKAFREAAQVVTKNTTEAIVYLKDYVSVQVGTGSDVLTTIIGQNVALSAIINLQKIYAQSGSMMYAVSALTTAITDVEIWSDEAVIIGAANIRGYESVSLVAMTEEVNHIIRSDSEIIGAIGVVKATTNVRGRMSAQVTTDAKTEIASADVLIQAFAPTMKIYAHTATALAVANTILQKVLQIIGYVVKWIAKAVAWFVGLFSKKAKKKILEAVYGWVDKLVSSTAISDLQDKLSSDSTIDLNGKISVGAAAAGIVVDINPDATISYTGIEVPGWSNGIVVDHVNKTITIPYIYNAQSGSISIDAGTGELKGQLAVYLNNYLTFVTINNHSDYDLILSDITLFNTDVNAFTYTTNAGTERNKISLTYGDETPVVSITSEKDTDVIFNGEINNVKGELNLNLNGGNVFLGDGAYTNKDEILRGDTEFLTRMFEGTSIWTNSLKITGAANVGQSATGRLKVGIVRYSGSNTAGRIAEPARNGKVWIEATGNIYVSLALLEVLISKEALSDAVLENQEPIDRLYLEKIKAGKTADLYLPIAKRLYVYENGIDYEGMEITSPGEYEELFILTPDQSIMNNSTQLVIFNAKGQDSGYRLGIDGLITLNDELSLDASVFDTKITNSITIGDTVWELRLYRLIDGSSIYVTGDGKVMLISSEKHTLNLTQFTYDLATNRILLNDTDNLTDSYISFDANNIPIMHIGTNGITMYVQQNADGSWTLPNGIRIYMLFALLNQNNEIVTSTYLGTDANNYRSFMIGSINDGTDKDVFYVYQVATIDGKQSFIASQKYQKTLIGTPVYGQIERKQTLEEAKAAAQSVINSYLSAGSVLTVAQITQLQTEIAAVVTDQIEVTLTLTQLRTISEKTTDVAGITMVTYQSDYVLFVKYTLKDLYENTLAQILDTQIALGQTPHLEDVLALINQPADQSGTSVGEVKTVTAAGASTIAEGKGEMPITQTQSAMTLVVATDKVNESLPASFNPESDVALSNLADTLRDNLTTNIGVSLGYTMTKNADYSYTCKVTITLSDGTTSTTIIQDYDVAGSLMTIPEAQESLETSILTGLGRSDIDQNTVDKIVGYAEKSLKENIKVTANLNRTETILQAEHAYRYDYELKITFINLADTTNNPAISTATYLKTFNGLAFMLGGTSPVVTQSDPQKAAAVNLKTQASTTNGTVIWITDGFGYTIRPDSVPGAADLYVKEKTNDLDTTYEFRIGSKTTNLEKLGSDGEYVNYRMPVISNIAGGAYYIFSIHSKDTGSYLKLYDLTTKGESGSKLVGGDHVFENGTKFLTNRIIALYPGSLTTSGKEQIVYVSLSAASEAVMAEARTLENSVIYLSLLTNQKQYVDDFGKNSPLYKDVSKRLIYQAATTTDYESIAEKQIGDVKYFLRGYIEYVNGIENYHYIHYTFAEGSSTVKDDLTLITDLTQINNLTQQYLEYYNELFKTNNKISILFDTESEIVFDTTKGGGIVLNPNGTIYYQPGTLLNPDGTTEYDPVLRTTQLGKDENGNYYVNKNQKIRVVTNTLNSETTIQMLYLDDEGNVYAVYDLKTNQMKWIGETGYTAFNTQTFTSSPVILSAGTKLPFSKVSDSVLTIMNGSEFFYYETEEDALGKERLTRVIYAGDKIDLIQLIDGTFIEVKEVIEETETTYTLRVADSGSKTKEKIVTYQKLQLVEGQILSAVSVRDEEYNPVMMAIKTTMGSYYIFPNGYTFGILIDGEAVFFQSEIVIEKLRHTETVLGSTIMIGNIEAQTVILTIQDAQAVIRDSGLFEAAITGNDIQIVTDANLGETAHPIRINTLEPALNLNQKGLVLKGLTGSGVYTKDAYIQGVINPIRISAIRLAESAHLILDAGNLDAYLEIMTDMKDRTQRIIIDHAKNLYVNATTPNQMIYLIIEEMTGALNLKNNGPAEVIVKSGNLMIGEININENALWLESTQGGIESEGSLPVILRAGRVTLKAKQQIDLRVAGNLMIQQILSEGKVTLTAPSGQILGSTNQPVIEAPELVLEALGIGIQSRPLWIKIMGSVALKAVQNIFIKQTGTALTGQIDAGGMVNLDLDGDIGSSATPLEISAIGAVFARANRIYLRTAGNLIIGAITAKELLQIMAAGSVTAASVSSILTAEEGDLVSLSGDLGTLVRPLRTLFGKLNATANNIYINNLKSLQIGQLKTNRYEDGKIFLQVAGNLTGEEGQTDLKAQQTRLKAEQIHLNAEEVRLLIYGNAGTLQRPLAIMTDRLNYYGTGRAYIHLLNPAPESVDMESEEQLMLEADGSLEKGVLKSEKVSLTAVLAIGLIEAPVLIYTNLLEITSGIDEMYYKLFKYVKPVKKIDIIENGQETGFLLSGLLSELKKEILKEKIPFVILPDAAMVALSQGRRGSGKTKQSIDLSAGTDSKSDGQTGDETGDNTSKDDSLGKGNFFEDGNKNIEDEAAALASDPLLPLQGYLIILLAIFLLAGALMTAKIVTNRNQKQ